MMNKYLLDDRSGTAGKMWQTSPPSPLRTAAAAAALVLATLSPFDAHALGLGRVTVLSALGEPLRAEIEVPQITAEEAASLRTGIPSPAAFRAAGVEYNPALAGAAITLQQRPDGRSYLRLTSDRIVSEPFLDLILEAHWSSGRLVRDYTLLFDPPSTRPPAPLTAGAPQVSAAPERAAATTRDVSTSRATQPPPPPVAAAPKRPRPIERAAPPQAAEKDPSGKTVTVQAGDTAGRIASANKPSEISLDQMLVALLRTNPDAFINGNVNRIKAGALIEIPTAEQAASVPTGEARKILSVQSANFNEFRRRLADAAPTQSVAAADRQVSGSVQPSVEEKKPTTSSPDKLTLSKGAVKATAPEAQIAKARQGKEANERVAELSKNISDLSRLQDKTATVASTAPASAARGPAVPTGNVASAPKPAAPAAPASVPAASPPNPAAALSAASSAKPGTATTAPASAAPASASAKAASAVASAPVAASTTTPLMATPSVSTAAGSSTATVPAPAASPAASAASAAASGPAPTASAAPASAPSSVPASKPKPAAVKPPPPPEPSLVDELLDNPVVPAAAGGLLALLAGFAFYRSRQRKKASQVDSSFLESRLQPDSFFGSSGGQRIDTADAAPTGSSLAYSPSQLDAAGDVDPVAEADVYLAYGRDLQAEEILKEALRMNPSRIAIHGKLLEIFAKRRDVRAFEVLAGDAFKLCAGEGAEWERICEFGRELDPENSLYQPGGRPKTKGEAANVAEAVAPVFASSTIPVEPHPDFVPSSSMPVDLDLGDLDLSFDAAAVSKPSGTATAPRDPVPSAPIPLDVELSWDDLAEPGAGEQTATPPAASPVAAPPVLTSAPAKAHEPDSGMIEFDLGSLSLDLDRSVPAEEVQLATAQAQGSDTDPLETKLALAQEFQSIGDSDGARTLVEEVVARATGPLKAKAQRFLAELD